MPIIKTTIMKFSQKKKCFKTKIILVYRLPSYSGINNGFLSDLIFGNKGNEGWKEIVREDFSRWIDYERLNKNFNILPMRHYKEEEKIIYKWLKSKDKYPNEKMRELIMLHRELGYYG